MAKDKRIAELPGISPAAVVALERVGFLSCRDLVNADFDRVAYVLDDYTEATRLVREARRLCGLANPSAHSGDPAPPEPLTSGSATRMPKSQSKGAVSASASNQGGTMDLSSAIGVLALGLGGGDGDDRLVLRRRLNAMTVLLEHKASEAELIACATLEAIEAGALESSEIAQQFGKNIVKLLDQCMTLRAVPMLPSGKLPPSYIENARSAPREARRVCAGHLVAMARTGEAADAHYLRAHLEALQAGGDEDLVDEAAAVVKVAARRAA